MTRQNSKEIDNLFNMIEICDEDNFISDSRIQKYLALAALLCLYSNETGLIFV